MNRIDILGVEAFVAIADMGSFNAAATCLYLSQTALSRRLKKLEEGLGVTLVARTTRSVSLTPDGELLLPQARQTLIDLSSTLEGMRKGGGRNNRMVRVGCLATLSPILLPPLLTALAEEFPTTRIRAIPSTAIGNREALLHGDIDFAVTLVGTVHPALEFEHFFTEHLIALCPLDHKLARHKFARCVDLEGLPLISLGSSTMARTMIDALASREQIPLSWMYEVDVKSAIALVQGGFGIAICPELSIAGIPFEPKPLKKMRLHPYLRREIALARRKLPLSSAADPLYHATSGLLRKFFGSSGLFVGAS